MNQRDDESETLASTFDTSTSLDEAMRALAQLPPQPADEAIPQVGALIDGRYAIEGVLGQGGMGVVFSARHVETGKPVALKWIRVDQRALGGGARAVLLARFAREARAAGRLHHPHVVQVYDARCTGGAPYLVMEKLEGESLRTRLGRGALDWDEVVRVLVPAMRGVAAAHAAGIIHRDLKPDNIFLARAPGSDIPCAKVLDFGVASVHAPEHDETLTRTGAVLGTLAYMPLEQLRGDPAVDARCDVYALGVVLYECLAGRRPFQAKSAAEYGALLATTRPERPSIAVPALRGRREAVILTALARDPRDRFGSVAELVAAVERAGAPAHGRRTAGALVAAGLVVAGATWLWGSREQPRALQPAVRSVPAPSAVRSVSAPSAARSVPAPTAPPRPQELEPSRPARVGVVAATPPSGPPTEPLPARTRVAPAPRPVAAEATPSPPAPLLDLSRTSFDVSDRPAAAPLPAVDTATRLRRDDF